MRKKLCTFAVILTTAAVCDRSFRSGFKHGWNEMNAKNAALGKWTPPNFKNV